MIKKLSFAKKVFISSMTVCISGLNYSCSNILDLAKAVFQNPKIAFNSFNYTGTDSSKVKFNLVLNVENPNTFGVKTSGVKYNLDLNSLSIINGDLNKGIEIIASGKNNVEIPIEVNFPSLIQLAPSLISDPNNLKYNVYGSVNFDTPIGAVPIGWKHEDNLNVQNILNWSQILFPTK